MKKPFNSSYSFTFGDVSFEVDIDESLTRRGEWNTLTAKSKILHSHPYYELFFIFDEETQIVFENERQKYKSSIVCLSPEVRHYTLRSNDYRILFSYSKKSGSRGGFCAFITDFLATGGVSHIVAEDSGLQKYLEELRDVFYNQKSELDGEVIVSLLKCIFYRAYSLYTADANAKNPCYSSKESRYIVICALVSECTTRDTDITVGDVAEALCLSKKQASRLIYKYYGKPLSEVITDEKLNYAAYLLKNTAHPVCDIALECNFNSYSYFCHRFKKRFGCAPLQYRKGI